MFNFFHYANTNITACVEGCEGFGSRFDYQLCVLGCEPGETNWVTLGISIGVLSVGLLSILYCACSRRNSPQRTAVETENEHHEYQSTAP